MESLNVNDKKYKGGGGGGDSLNHRDTKFN